MTTQILGLQIASTAVAQLSSNAVGGGGLYGRVRNQREAPDGDLHAFDPESLAATLCGLSLTDAKLKRWKLPFPGGSMQRNCPACLKAAEGV